MALIGKIIDFHEGKEEWSQYIERLDLYFKANGITSEGKKQATLLTVIGPSSYKLVRNLVAPVKPADMKYADLVQALNKHHNPVPSEIVQRCKFNSRCRMEEESISEFMASLRSLAELCNFGSTLDTMLRDRLVCGVRNDRIQRRLLAEKKLDLQTAVEIATSIETAAINVRDLQAAQSTREMVHRMSSIDAHQDRKPKPCFRKNNHTPDMCKFKESTCHFCQKKGHIATVCHSKAPQQEVKAVGVDDPASHAADDRVDGENGTYRLFKLKMDRQQTQSSSSAREPLHQRTNPGRPCSNNHIGNQSSNIAPRVNNQQGRQEERYFKYTKDRLCNSEGEKENGHRDKRRNDDNRAREIVVETSPQRNPDVDDDIEDDDDGPSSSTATAECPKLQPPVPSAERPREPGKTSEPREAYPTRDRKPPKR